VNDAMTYQKVAGSVSARPSRYALCISWNNLSFHFYVQKEDSEILPVQNQPTETNISSFFKTYSENVPVLHSMLQGQEEN